MIERMFHGRRDSHRQQTESDNKGDARGGLEDGDTELRSDVW